MDGLIRDLSFIRGEWGGGGGRLVQMGGGSLKLMSPKRGGPPKITLGFGEGHTIFCKHCCSLK